MTEHFQSYVAKHATVFNDQYIAETAFSADRGAEAGKRVRISLAVFDRESFKTYKEATTDYEREKCKAILLVKDLLPVQYSALIELLAAQGVSCLSQIAVGDSDVQRIDVTDVTPTVAPPSQTLEGAVGP